MGCDNESVKPEEKISPVNVENRKEKSFQENKLTILKPDYKPRETKNNCKKDLQLWVFLLSVFKNNIYFCRFLRFLYMYSMFIW